MLSDAYRQRGRTMNVLDWSRSVKPDLLQLQQTTGIPALWAVAQMCHESAVDGESGLSDLATNAQNYAGLKWAEWQRRYGCSPVQYGTWEVLDGQNVTLDAAFCRSPSWPVWLKVYADLLTGSPYSPALAYGSDPLLYGLHVWQSGWATDPQYIVGVGGWMTRLYPDYQDTVLPARQASAAASMTIPVLDRSGKQLCVGTLADDRTLVPVRALADALGVTITWDEANHRVVWDV